MFEAALSDRFKAIFGLKNVSYDLPSESREQEKGFIQVQQSRCHVRDGRETAMVKGKLLVFADANKLPFGYFAKHIDAAPAAITQGLYFFDFEENASQYLNIVERSLSFVYLYDNQYDPNLGEITSVELSITET